MDSSSKPKCSTCRKDVCSALSLEHGGSLNHWRYVRAGREPTELRVRARFLKVQASQMSGSFQKVEGQQEA
jgi:hypothetical protein